MKKHRLHVLGLILLMFVFIASVMQVSARADEVLAESLASTSIEAQEASVLEGEDARELAPVAGADVEQELSLPQADTYAEEVSPQELPLEQQDTNASSSDMSNNEEEPALAEPALQEPALEQQASVGRQDMYRLYNPNSGEHFYTANAYEKNHLVGLGWRYEGIGWVAPQKSNTPVYRLYNPNAGDHHYTMSKAERDMLKGVGWRYEGIGWYSDDAKGVPLHRQYNPNAKTGTHNYTTNKAENDWLVSLGWRAEGIGWYGIKSSSKPTNPLYTVRFVSEEEGQTKTISEQKLTKGAKISIPSNPTRERYEFRGWDPEIKQGATCQGDATYKARWAPKTTTEKTEEDHAIDDGDIIYKEGLGSLDGEVSADGTSATVPAAQAKGVKAGDIVIVDRDSIGGGAAIKVSSVSTKGNTTTIKGSQPALEEVFESINISGTEDIDGGYYVPEPGVTLVAQSDSSEPALDAQLLDVSEAGTHKGKTATAEILDNKISVSVTPTFEYAVKWSLFDGFDKTKLVVDLDAKIHGEIAKIEKNQRIGIATYYAGPIEVFIFVDVNVNGSLSVNYRCKYRGGAEYTKKGGLKPVNEFTSGDLTINMDAGVQVGPGLGAKLALLGYTLADTDVNTGIQGTAELTARVNPVTSCLQLDAWWYVDISFGQNSDILKKLKLDKSWHPIEKKNSPLKYSQHFEDGNKVDKCTRQNDGMGFTVTFKDGVDGQVLKTQTVTNGKAAEAPNPPSHPGYTFSKWDKSFSKVTSNLTVTATYTKDNKGLNDYTWAELSQISKEISSAATEAKGIEIAKNYGIIGSDGKLDSQTKTVSVNGLEAHVQIIGINHDDKTAGGKAGLTFQFVECVTGHVMNPGVERYDEEYDYYYIESTNQGGWKSSEMRSWLASDFMGQLPQDLTSVIVPVNKLTNNVGYTESVSSVTTTSDKLWLPSIRELCGEIAIRPDVYAFFDDVRNAEGEQYKRFRDAGVDFLGVERYGEKTYPELVKTALTNWVYWTWSFNGDIWSQSVNEPCDWWCRSACPDANEFESVNSDGSPIAIYCWVSGNALGVAPSFCI